VSDRLIVTTSADAFTRGLDYLYGIRSLAPDPEMIDLIHDSDHRDVICTWIGQKIDSVNQRLNQILQDCHNCFHTWEQPPLQIFAAPFARSFGIDAICNLETEPITILVDVGRVLPEDWLLLVLHEYAHAHAGSPGHHLQFARSLTHLCLGLEVTPPIVQAGQEDCLRFYPPCPLIPDPLAFWRGEGCEW
jgi:hypothetical protein